VHESIIRILPPPPLYFPRYCNTIARPLSNARPPQTPFLYAIPYTKLVWAISCKGQGVMCDVEGLRWEAIRVLWSGVWVRMGFAGVASCRGAVLYLFYTEYYMLISCLVIVRMNYVIRYTVIRIRIVYVYVIHMYTYYSQRVILVCACDIYYTYNRLKL